MALGRHRPNVAFSQVQDYAIISLAGIFRD